MSMAERANRPRTFFAFRQKSLFITGRTSIRCQKQRTKRYSVPYVHVFVCMFVWFNIVIGHLGRILNAHGTNASPDGLCTRTHTNEAFSCWFCCNSFRVDRARRGNVCLEAWLGHHKKAWNVRTRYRLYHNVFFVLEKMLPTDASANNSIYR